MTMKKGNIILQVVIALLIMSVVTSLVFNMASLSKNMAKEKKIAEMSKYWNNLERFKIYLPIEKPLDIVY
ncbi:MAG: hypothetical protein ACI4WG_06330 [Erysipelotrichaceae bacterium]